MVSEPIFIQLISFVLFIIQDQVSANVRINRTELDLFDVKSNESQILLYHLLHVAVIVFELPFIIYFFLCY